MSIKFKPIKKGQPGVVGGGVKKNYASPVHDGEVNEEDLILNIEKRCTVNGADVRAVIYSLLDISVESLAKGSIVRLGDLGSLRVSLSSEGVATADDVTASTIKNANVIFTPGAKIKRMLAVAKFEKAQEVKF